MDGKGIDWRSYETILLDMDGTILDLAFDNYFWRELVPRCLARARQITREQAKQELFATYLSKEGSLDWYCLDYWTAELGLDIKQLKSASSQRIRFLPGAREFLIELSAHRRRVFLVTNAHKYTLQIKKGVAGLERYFHDFVTAHDFGSPKEHADFWPAVRAHLDFDPASTLFVDDSVPVLDAAARFGIAGVVAVTQPDSGLPVKRADNYQAVSAIADLLRN
jgi:HAD superfamily hydrolase (TIGR01509 family)